MVDAQGSITSLPPLRTKRSPSSSWQGSSQTSWSGEQSLPCLKCQGEHQRSCQSTSSIATWSASHPGATQWKGAQFGQIISPSPPVSSLYTGQSSNQRDSSVSSIGVKASLSRKSPSIHVSHRSWRSTKASSSMKVIHRHHQWQPSRSIVPRSSSSESTHFICELWFSHSQNLTLKQIVSWSASINNSDNSRCQHQQQPLSSSTSAAVMLNAAKLSPIAQKRCRGCHLHQGSVSNASAHAPLCGLKTKEASCVREISESSSVVIILPSLSKNWWQPKSQKCRSNSCSGHFRVLVISRQSLRQLQTPDMAKNDQKNQESMQRKILRIKRQNPSIKYQFQLKLKNSHPEQETREWERAEDLTKPHCQWQYRGVQQRARETTAAPKQRQHPDL